MKNKKNKLIMRLPIILIGLSLFLLTGCILFNIDPPQKWCTVKFLNTSKHDIIVKMINHPLSGDDTAILIPIESSREEGTKEFVYENNAIEEYFSIIADNSDVKIEIYLGNIIVKQWNGSSGSFGDSINSPFNYDSWVFESIKPTGENIVGEIVFTITDEDIE
ncbi:MAG: hypothetical protein COB60_12580 [Flavobacteriaceae bacterium]|nr:MAG: hypothetical protein COB60_12580 [Flavobacteriaceae bacterium]